MGLDPLKTDRCIECIDLEDRVSGYSDLADHLQVTVPVFDQKPRLVSHQEVTANKIGLSAVSQPDIFPCLMACHDVVDSIDGHLEDQDTDFLITIEDGRRNKGGWRVVGWLVGFEIL